MTTRAAVLGAPRAQVEIRDMDVLEPRTGEVLVRLEACGLCHSDLFVCGLERLPHSPLVLGHEGIGLVAAVGPGANHWAAGDRVGLTFLAATCGGCDLCRSGRERYCARQLNFGYTVDGALACHAVVPAAHLTRVPAELSAHEAAPLCCAGWTAFGAVRETGLLPGQWLGIFGAGGLGHLAIQYARLLGLRVAVADPFELKLEMARQLGAELTACEQHCGRSLHRQTGGMDAALVLTPNIDAIQEAFRSLKRCGTLVLVGLSPDEFQLPLVDTILRGITVRGSYLGTAADLEQVFRLARDGAVRPHVAVHELEEVPMLLAQMRRGGVVGRAVISFS